jgi:hypothetical protein
VRRVDHLVLGEFDARPGPQLVDDPASLATQVVGVTVTGHTDG